MSTNTAKAPYTPRIGDIVEHISSYGQERGEVLGVNADFGCAYVKWDGSKSLHTHPFESLIFVASEPEPTSAPAAIPHNTGVKYDAGKPDMALLPSTSITKIAQVLSYGATKYADHNWRKGMNWSRVASAALRHIFAWLGGEDTDPETGLSHLAHAGCCILFLLEYEDTHKALDNRYKPTKGA